MLKTALIIFITALSFVAVNAMAAIVQTEYTFQMDIVKTDPCETFVICDKCSEPGQLTSFVPEPPVILAIRFSEDPDKAVISSTSYGQQVPIIEVKEEQLPKLSQNTQTVVNNPSVPEYLTTVHFDFNSYKLRDNEKKSLDSISASSKLKLIGYTCDIGNESYNQRLSEKRALSVKEYLNTKGLNAIETIGQGKCCPVSNDKKLNRRVEILNLN